MLGLLYVDASGLISYGKVVKDLEYSIHGAPRRSDLVVSVAPLLEPLIPKPREWELKSPAFGIAQADQLEAAYQKADQDFAKFRTRIESMPSTPQWQGTREMILRVFDQIQVTLHDIPQHIPGLRDVATREKTSDRLRDQILILQTLAMKMPDPTEYLWPTFQEERVRYQQSLTQLIVISIAACALLGCFTFVVFSQVLEPIKQLRLGAQRVASGDDAYQVQIPTTNELGELARVFNQVTRQFHENNLVLDRKVQERTRELNVSGRLASVGFLAAGVAHEINNPILAINIAAESLEYRISPVLEHLEEEDRGVVCEYLHMIQKESTRCQSITERLLEFARGSQSIEKQPVDLAMIVTEVVGMIQHLHKYHDRKIDFQHRNSVTVQAIGPEIKQVVLNLVSNALEAIDPGGVVQIELIETAQHVDILVRDSGCGMTPEVIEHLFDPFFTQRRDGRGTGLGLSITQRIVQDHGGTIEPTSAGPGQGSTFRVRLPRKVATKKAPQVA